MAFQAVPNTAGVEVLADYHGEAVENTFYYLYPTTPTQAELQDLVDVIGAYVLAEWIEFLPPQWIGRQVYGRGLSVALDVQASNTAILGVPGGAASAGLPGNVTLAIKRASGLTGRSARGRIYWQGIPELQAVGNNSEVAYANAITAMLDGMDAAATAEGWTPVIVSRRQSGALLTTALTYPIVDWSIEDYRLDSQRRRLAGRGS